MAQTDTAGQLSWLLDNLVGRVEHVRQAVILSRDGLVVATSQNNMAREDGDTCPRGRRDAEPGPGRGSPFRAGEVRQTIIEMEAGFLFVTAAGQGLPRGGRAADADIGLIAYEMAMLVTRLGSTSPLRPGFPTRQPPRSDREDGSGGQVGRPGSRPGRPALRDDRGPDPADPQRST